MAALALPSPVLGGDWPDPSLVFDNGEHVAVTTSGGWAPSMRVLRSPDLKQWRITGAVFREPPRWAAGFFWAPEITRLGSGFAVYYSALPRTSKTIYCLGVATAPTPEGPWRDHGRPLRCGPDGSIDPFPVRDERGGLHLLWKSNGNRFGHRTPIYAQRLSEDGLRLAGPLRELIRNDRPWEKRVVEAPAVIRAGDGFFYLFYSGAQCCARPCDYGVGVARSTRLLGPWRKYPGNPILRSGNGWRCPGHTEIADDGAGNLTAVFHAYRGGNGFMAGRQLLAAPLTFGAGGWPRIGDGRPPAPVPGAAPTGFSDDFAGPLAPEWEWPLNRAPAIGTGASGLRLRAPLRERDGDDAGRKLDAGLIARRTGTHRYTAFAVVDRAALRGKAAGGLASYKNSKLAIGIATDRGRVVVWQRDYRGRVLAEASAPASPLVYLRMVARGRRFSFAVSPDGVTWKTFGRAFRSPVKETARVALTAGGERRAQVRFASAMLAE